LLDSDELNNRSILAVVANKGVTEIAHISSEGRDVLKKHLFSPGELLRLNQIQPDEEERKAMQQLDFGQEFIGA
jgi:hypothetical protein